MKKRKTWWIVAGVAFIAVTVLYGLQAYRSTSQTSDTREPPAGSVAFSPTPGRVAMIDLGATECVPCKMMAPIMRELEKEYSGKADIVFIDVWRYPDQAKKYGVRTIPTQIFFDAEGREVHRHTGFMNKQAIVDMLSRLGVS